MRLSIVFQAFSLFCLFLFFLTAQGLSFTLDECVDLALRKNPEMGKQQMNLEFSRAELSDQKGQKLGRLNIVSTYTHYNLPRTLVPLTPGSIASNPTTVPTTEDLFVTGISYEIELFTGFAQTRAIEVAVLQKELASATLKLSKEQLIYNVKTLYVNILSLQAQKKAQTDYVESLRQLYEQITDELQFGKKALIDQLKAAADLESARARQAQISANINILKASLAGLLTLDQLPPLQDINLPTDSIHVVQNEFAEQLATSERLRVARLTVHKNAKLADKAAAALYPQIALNAAYGQNFGPNDSSHPDNGNWNNQEVWQLGLSLKWNIFDFGSTRSKINKARFIEQQSRYEQTQAELELKRAIKEAVTRINTTVSDYLSARSERDMTQKTVAIEQVRFDKGAASINDLLYSKARNQLAESRFIAAGYAYKTAGFQLEYLLETGETR